MLSNIGYIIEINLASFSFPFIIVPTSKFKITDGASIIFPLERLL